MELSQVLQALRNADAAGDVEGARKLAQIAQQLSAQQAPAPAKAPEDSLIGSAIRGAKSMIGSERTGLASLMDANKAATEGVARQREIAAQHPSEDSWEKVKKAYEEKGFLSAVGEYGRQIPYAIAEQTPQLAQSRLGAAAGAATPIPGGALAGAFIPAYAQQYGSFLEEQAKQQQEKGQPVDVSRFKAAATAIPAAAIDVLETFIPMGKSAVKSLFPSVAKLLDRGATKEAEALAMKQLASEGFLKTLGKGTVRGVALETPGEVAQQMLQRAQSGQSLFDEDALADYGRTAFQTTQLGPLGAVGRFQDKSAARTGVQEEKNVAATKERVAKAKETEAAAAAETARKQTPEYAFEINQQYRAAEQAKADLKLQIKKIEKGSLTETADREHNKVISAQLKAQEPALRELGAEYNRVKSIVAQAEQNKPFELTPSPTETPAAAQEPTKNPTQMLERKRQAQQLLENNQQELSDYTANNDMAGFDSAMKQRKVLMSEVSQLDTQMKALGIEDNQIDPVALQTQIGKETDKLTSMAGPGFDPDKAEKQRAKITKLQTQLQNATSGQTGLDLGAPRTLELPLTAAQNQRNAMAAKGTVAGAQRISTVEQEEQDALQTQRDEETRLAQEAETNRQRAAKVAPEMAALQRMKQRPSPITENLSMFGTEEGPPTTSPAFGQMQQALLGTPEEERMLPTAEGEKKRDLRRVPGAEFKLRPRLEGTPVPSREELADRLNRVLTTHELSADAVYLLRRVEQALPTKLDPDYANALDRQLSRIESGEEGVPRKGQGRTELLQIFPTETPTRAETAAPTEAYKKELDEITGAAPGQAASVSQQEMYAQRQRLEDTGKPGKLPGFVAQPEDEARRSVLAGIPKVTKRADNTTATTLRGPSAAPGSVLPSTTRNSLTLGNDIAPYLQMAEQAAAEDAGQMPLFPKEDRELLGVVKEDAAAFQRFMNSPYLRNLRIQMQKDRTKVASANTFLSRALPKLQAMVAEAKAIEVRMGKLKRWENFVDANKDLLNLQADTKNMALRINNLKLEKSDLSARIESYEQARERVIRESQRSGAAGKGRLGPVLKELSDLTALTEEAQAARMQTQGLLDLLQAQIKVLIGEPRIAQLKAEATTTDAVNASAQNEIARLRDAVTQAQETVATEGREKKKAAVAATRAEAGATAANTSNLTQDISDTRTRLWNIFLSGEAAEKGTRVRALTDAERDAREKGLTSDGAKEIQYANELYNKKLKWLEQEKGNVEKRLVEAEKQVRAAKKKSGEYVGGEQNVQAFKGLGAAIRLQANASVRLESLEDAIAFRRAQDEERITARAPRTVTPDTENAALLEDAFAVLKNKPAIQGKVSQATRIQSSAPGKLRTGTEESKANAEVTKQPVVEQRDVDENTASTSEDMRIANEEAARMQSMSKKEKNKVAREAKANEKAEQELAGADAELEAVMRKQNKTIQNKKGKDSFLFSRGVPTEGLTTTELRNELRRAVGDEDTYANKVSVFASVDEFLKEKPEYVGQIPSDAKAFVDPDTERAYMFAENIGKGEGMGILLHEVGVHIGFRNFFNTAQFNAIAKTVRNWANAPINTLEGKIGRAAKKRAEDAGTSAAQMDDELIAYAVEEAVKAGVKPAGTKSGSAVANWLRMVVNAFNKALKNLGIAPEKLTVGDLVNMAYGAAQIELKGTWHGTAGTFTEFDHAYMGTGEGTQVFGWGTYRAQRKSIGDYYRETAAEAAIQRAYDHPEFTKWLDDAAITIDGVSLKTLGSKGRPMRFNAPKPTAPVPTNKSVVNAQGTVLAVPVNQPPLTYKKDVPNFPDNIRQTVLDALAEVSTDQLYNGKPFNAVTALKDVLNNANTKESKTALAWVERNANRIKGGAKTKAPVDLNSTGRLLRTLHEQHEDAFFNLDNQIPEQSDRVRTALEKMFTSLPNEQKAEFNRQLAGEQNPTGKEVYDAFKLAIGNQKTVSERLNSFGVAGNKFLDRLSRGKPVTEDSRYNYVDFLDKDQGAAIVASNLEPVGPATELLFSKKAPKYANDGLAGAGAVADKLIAKQRTVMDTVKTEGLGLGLATRLIDRFAPLERISKLMDSLKGTQMMYYARMYDQRMNFVSQSVGNGAVQLVEKTRADGRKEWIVESKTGASLKNVVDILKTAQAGSPEANSRLFSLYLAAKRAERVGLNKLNFGGNVTQADLNSAMAAIKATPGLADTFADAQREYNQYNKGLVQFAVDTGALSKEAAAEMTKANDYVPYYRTNNGSVEMLLGKETITRVGNLKEQPYLKELVGGDEQILDFMTSSVQNTNMLTDMALRNLATKNAVFELQGLGMATVGKGSGASGPDVVKFKMDGQERFAIVDTQEAGFPGELLVEGLEGIPTQTTWLTKAMGGPARVLRKAVVLNPLYAARQIFRDSLAAPLLSGADFAPVMGALRQIGKPSKQTLEQRGITGGQVFTGTQEDLTKILRDMSENKAGWAQGLARLEAISMEADALTRRAQYDSYIKQGLSEMEATFMALESMNFSKRGASPAMHTLSTIIPFFNAQVQSLNVLYKAMSGNMPFNEKLKIREKLLARGMVVAGMSMLYAALMQDDETYKNATPDQKYGNWFIHLPGVEEAVRIPIPFEVGYIFKALPEAIVNTMMSEHGGEDAAKAFKQIALQLIPGGTSWGIPQALKPAFEVALGKSTFTGRDLESAHEQSLLPGQRVREKTTALAAQIGGAFNVSPIKIDALIQGYTSTMGLAFVQALSFAIPTPPTAEKATGRLSEMPIVNGLFQPKDAGGVINAAYDRMKEAEQVKNTFNDLIQKGKAAEAKEFLQNNLEQFALSGLATNFTTVMQKLSEAERAVKASNADPEKKREQLDALRQQKIKMAQMARSAAS